jgi:hypothetical protein
MALIVGEQAFSGLVGVVVVGGVVVVVTGGVVVVVTGGVVVGGVPEQVAWRDQL